jgi:hypothetical protein
VCDSKPTSIVGGVSGPTLGAEDGVSPLTETTSDDKTKKSGIEGTDVARCADESVKEGDKINDLCYDQVC